jgi:hypothetical protein
LLSLKEWEDASLSNKEGAEPEVPASPLDGMTSREVYDWEWNALPSWAKFITFVIGGPAFAVIIWSVFDEDAVSSLTRTVCFLLFLAVALMQIYCLNKIIRDAKRRGR